MWRVLLKRINPVTQHSRFWLYSSLNLVWIGFQPSSPLSWLWFHSYFILCWVWFHSISSLVWPFFYSFFWLFSNTCYINGLRSGLIIHVFQKCMLCALCHLSNHMLWPTDDLVCVALRGQLWACPIIAAFCLNEGLDGLPLPLSTPLQGNLLTLCPCTHVFHKARTTSFCL